MPTQAPDSLATAVDNPILKGFFALVTFYGFIAKYLKAANARRVEASTISARYQLGFVFWLIQRFPFIVHSVVAYLALIGAILELGLLLDEFLNNRAALIALPAVVQKWLSNFSAHFVWYFLLAAVLFVLFDMRVLESVLARVLGALQKTRHTIDWANANWQLKPEAERRILAPSASELQAFASRVVDELVRNPRGDSLALRPADLTDEFAANILFFGHAIEEYSATVLKRSFAWTTFYASLAKVANAADTPFSAANIRGFSGAAGFFSVVLRANPFLVEGEQIPNNAGLEQAVKKAFETLQGKLDGDARRLTNAIASTDYSAVLKRSRLFLGSIHMRRQFAKLFILWNVKPRASHPDVFRVAFNTGIFLKYLDTGVIRYEGDRFDCKSELVDICFEVTESLLMRKVYSLLSETQDKERVAWREKEQQDVSKHALDWVWWIYYRADVQTYHNFRSYTSQAWTRQGNEVIKNGAQDKKPKPAAGSNEEAPVEA